MDEFRVLKIKIMRKQQHKHAFGKQCQQIIDEYNKELKKKLIPSKDEPIYGSLINPNDEDFHYPIEQVMKTKAL